MGLTTPENLFYRTKAVRALVEKRKQSAYTGCKTTQRLTIFKIRLNFLSQTKRVRKMVKKSGF
jgi:hypothetical protein